MRRLEVSALIKTDAQRVWDLYADVPGSAQWVPFVDEVLFVSGPPGVGQLYRERTRLAGVSAVSEWRIIEWDPPRRQVQLSTDMHMQSRLIIQLQPLGDGTTRLSQSIELHSSLPRVVGWLHERVFGLVAAAGARRAVAAAKARLEHR
jgi:hypothetical protein